MPLVASTLSFECDETSRESMSVVGSTDSPIIYQANVTNLRLSLFEGEPSSATFISDISNILSARLIVRKNHPQGTVLIDSTATLDATTTYVTWSNNTKQHLLFELTDVETNQAVPSDGTLDIYAVVEITTADGPVVVGFFNGSINYDGITGVDNPELPGTGAQHANYVHAGPTSGSPDLPTFRALVAADVAGLGLGGGGSGTVTSIDFTAPNIFTVTGAPINISGTIDLALATQSANRVFAGPSSGSAATPGFRSLVANDIPNLSDLNGAATALQVPIPTSKILYVDVTNGHDSGPSIGIRGDKHRPFASLESAYAAASSGDVIEMTPETSTAQSSSGIVLAKKLTIRGHGATFQSFAADNTALEFDSGANGSWIIGLTFDGQRSGVTPGVRSMVYVHSAANIIFDCCRFQNAQLNALGIDGTSDNITVTNRCTFTGNFRDITTPSLTSTAVTNLRILDNDFLGPYVSGAGTKAIGLNTQVVTGYRANHIILGNRITGIYNEAIEIQGSMYDNTVAFNTGYGMGTLVSIDGANGTKVTNNKSKGATVYGYEFVNAQDCFAGNNIVDAKDDSGTIVTQNGYSISDGGHGVATANLVIDGGELLDCGLHSIQIYKQDKITIKNLFVRVPTTGGNFYTQFSQGLTVEDCWIDASKVNGCPFYHEFTNAINAAPAEFHYKNNTVNTITALSQIFLFSSTSGVVAYTGVTIEGTNVIGANNTFCPSGFIEVRSPATSATLYAQNNIPVDFTSTNILGSQYGFPNNVILTKVNTWSAVQNFSSTPTNDGALNYNIRILNNATAYNANPTAGIEFGTIYTAGGATAGGGGIGLGKVNATDGNYSFWLDIYTRNNGSNITRSARFHPSSGVSVNSTTDPGAGNLLLAGLTASSFVETDANKVLVSKTANEIRIDLGLVIGTNVQVYDPDLTTWAGITPGTGVGTALAINVGSAGAFVTFNGALGTPSAGTLTNATGLPISTGVSGLATGIATFLATSSSANLAGAITDEVGYSTGAKLVFNQGPTIYDNAGTPKISANFSGRVLYATDGITEIVDWNGTNIALFDGSNSINADGTSDLIPQTVGSLTHQFGYDVGVGGTFSTRIGDNTKISSEDGLTYFDNSGFHGTSNIPEASGLFVVLASSSSLTANRTLTLNMGNVAHTLAFGTTANTITFPNAASGTVAFLNLAQTWTAAQSITLANAQTQTNTITGLGTTTLPGLQLTNTTAAAVGAQQVSPSLRWTGQGWKTTATAASQAVDARFYLLPIQGAANPTAALTGDFSINGGAFSTAFSLTNDKGLTITGTDSSGQMLKLTSTYGSSTFSRGGSTLSLDTTFQINTATVATSKLDFLVSGNAQASIGTNGVGVAEINNGTSGQWAALKLGTRDSGTTTTTNGLTIGHQSTGTPAAGLGSGILFNINSSTTADQNAAQIAALWTDATHATRTADIVFYGVSSAAALAETFRVKANGVTVHTAPSRYKGYTVAGLPAGTQGDRAFVTDALAPAFLATAVGGGAVVTPVFYNGTNWVAE